MDFVGIKTYRYEKNKAPEENAPIYNDRISKSLHHWACKERSSIYEYHAEKHTPVGMSKCFRKLTRPIFHHIYDVIRKGKVYEALLESIEVDEEGFGKIIKRDYKDVTLDGLRQTINDLEELIRLVEASEFPCHPKLEFINSFYKLTDYVKSITSLEEMRHMCYYIFKNPIVYDDECEIIFLMDKLFRISKMDTKLFNTSVKIESLMHLVTKEHGALYEIKNMKGIEWENHGDPASSIAFAANTYYYYQDFERLTSLCEIYDHLFSVMYDVVPLCFYGVVMAFEGKGGAILPGGKNDPNFAERPKWETLKDYLKLMPNSDYMRGLVEYQ